MQILIFNLSLSIVPCHGRHGHDVRGHVRRGRPSPCGQDTPRSGWSWCPTPLRFGRSTLRSPRDPHPPKDPLVPAFLTTAIGPGWTPSLPAVHSRMDSSGEDGPRRYPPAVTRRAGEQVNAYGTHPRPHRAPVAGFAPSASVGNCPEQPTIRDSNPPEDLPDCKFNRSSLHGSSGTRSGRTHCQAGKLDTSSCR